MNEHTTVSRSDKNFVGEILESNNSGKFQVIKNTGERTSSGSAIYKVGFLDTGYIATCTKGNALRGRVRDPYAPTMLGVACGGDTPVRTPAGKRKKAYTRWHNMIYRCYDATDKQFKDYGGRGIKVCQRWLCFEHYEADLPRLPGYSDASRDTIDRADNDGDYSPGNCRWASRKQQNNNQRPCSHRYWFVATSPNGERFLSNNQKAFAREHGLRATNVCGCLNGRQKTHRGWTFIAQKDQS